MAKELVPEGFTLRQLKPLLKDESWELHKDEQERWTQGDKGSKAWQRYGWYYLMTPDGEIHKGKTWWACAKGAGLV